ncbi:MAG: ABC transporter ATP-binding protein [bacterium]
MTKQTDPFREETFLGRAYDARLMRRLWPFVRPHTRWLGFSLAFMPVATLAGLAQPYLIKVVIDSHIVPGTFSGIGLVLGAYLAAILVEFAARFGELYGMNLVGQRVVFDLRRTLFAHLQRQDGRFFDRNPVGRLVTRLTSDTEAVSDMFASGVVAIVADVAMLVGIVVVLWLIAPKLALVTYTVLPPLALIAVFFRARLRDAFRAIRVLVARLNTYLQENIIGMTVVQLFGREGRNFEAFRTINDEYFRVNHRSNIYDASFYAVVDTLSSITLALLVWFGGGQILQGALTFGVLVAFFEYVQRFFLPIRDLSAKFTIMQQAMASLERTFTLLDTTPAVASPAAPAPLPARSGAQGGAVAFEGVWFSYNGEAEWVLRDLSFRVAPGETVAIVGATGAGKTTIIKLLQRFYEVRRGRILIDGLDVRSVSLEALRRRIALVLQDVFLFAGTVEHNVRLGEAIGPEAVARAVEAARVNSFVHAHPAGLQMPVAERGRNLSAGQRQLIAFSRALAFDRPILVLDEATSSVDPETESLIQEALHVLLEGRTAIVIAHRLSTIQGADRILVLHKGRLREEGTHQELLARKGLYHTLYKLQYRGQEAAARKTRS